MGDISYNWSINRPFIQYNLLRRKLKMNRMFDNIGRKLQTLAGVTTILGIIICVVLGIVLMVLGTILTGIVCMICGSLAAWIGSWVLYGFGEIILKLTEIAENTKTDNKDGQKKSHIIDSNYSTPESNNQNKNVSNV